MDLLFFSLAAEFSPVFVIVAGAEKERYWSFLGGIEEVIWFGKCSVVFRSQSPYESFIRGFSRYVSIFNISRDEQCSPFEKNPKSIERVLKNFL